MGLPKNYRKNLKFTPTPEGFQARQNILNDIANPGTYLPKGILHEDDIRHFQHWELFDSEVKPWMFIQESLFYVTNLT